MSHDMLSGNPSAEDIQTNIGWHEWEQGCDDIHYLSRAVMALCQEVTQLKRRIGSLEVAVADIESGTIS